MHEAGPSLAEKVPLSPCRVHRVTVAFVSLTLSLGMLAQPPQPAAAQSTDLPPGQIVYTRRTAGEAGESFLAGLRADGSKHQPLNLQSGYHEGLAEDNCWHDGTGCLPSRTGTVGASWSPDGTKIAAGTTGGAIVVMNLDGTDERGLTNGTFRNCCEHWGDFDYAPDWSPDGSQIVFARELYDPVDEDVRYQLWIMDADGSDAHPIYGSYYASDVSNPDWSPLGNEILVDGLLSIATNGTVNQARSDSFPSGDFPAWSPDGSQIAFSDYDGLSVMNADGSELRQLASDVYEPSWSPDGRKIVGSRGVAPDEYTDLAIVDVATGTTTPLATFTGDPEHASAFYSPAWQPCPGGACPGSVDPRERTIIAWGDGNCGSIRRPAVCARFGSSQPFVNIKVVFKVKRRGRWVKAATRTAATYAVAKNWDPFLSGLKVPMPVSSRARVIGTYPGDETHRPSKAVMVAF